MATVTRYINTASTPGGDGTTNATTGANRAYASMNEWEGAENTDLPTDGDTHVVNCTGGADTTAVTIDGWTTDATHVVDIQVTDDHGGKENTSVYRLAPSSDITSYLLAIYEDYVNVTGLQLFQSTSNASAALYNYWLNSGANQHNYDKLIIKSGGSSPGKGLLCDWDNSNYKVTNTVIYDCTWNMDLRGATVEVYNVTLVSGTTGNIWSDGSAKCINVLSYSTGINFSGTYDAGSGYNQAYDASCPGTNNQNSITADQFVDKTNKDFHLAASVNAIDNGTSAGMPTDDIDGVARAGSWDIGADEYVAAGGGETITLDKWYQSTNRPTTLKNEVVNY